MSWLVGRSELTVAQSRAVELSPRYHRLVLGSPGSGKTIVLLHRARELIDANQITPERFRLFVYTNALKDYIRAGLRDLALPDECVMTFDSWCREYYQNHIGHKLPWNSNEKSYAWDTIRASVWKHSRQLTTSDHLYDFVMVDEGQDLDVRDFQTLSAVAKHVTVFMDPKQKLYEKDATEMGVAQALGLRRRDLTLLEAYRCSPFIVKVAAAFIANEEERKHFIEQNSPIEKGERQAPLLYLAIDETEELEHLIEVLRTRINRNERIAVLFPTTRLMFRYARALRNAGLGIEVKQRLLSSGGKKKGVIENENTIPSIDFRTSLPKLMPYPSSKGLTFDTVLMPCLQKEAFRNIDTARIERLLFVGMTRATRWIQFSTIKGENVPFWIRFQELGRKGQIAIQSNANNSETVQSTEPVNDGSNGSEPLIDQF